MYEAFCIVAVGVRGGKSVRGRKCVTNVSLKVFTHVCGNIMFKAMFLDVDSKTWTISNNID